jgi:uncharacterized protein with FMN-binding domain
MKAGAWLVLGGAVAGFLGVLGLHRPASSSALAGGTVSQGPGPQGPGPTASPGRTTTAAGPPGTVTGPVVNYGYGELATRVAISGSRITGVSVPVIRVAEQFSQELADRAIPVLRHEVLAAQSAHIQAVSGATYTSEAYAQSVQAALDRAHFK